MKEKIVRSNNIKKMVCLVFIFCVISSVFIPSILSVKLSNETFSQTESSTLINEGFENGFPPTNWSNDGWLDSAYGYTNNGSHWAFSWYANDVLTTPSLNFGSDTTLTFWYNNEQNPMSLEVWIDGYNTGSLIWSDYNYSFTDYTQATINLKNYTGPHTISFCSKTDDFYGQMMDNIMIQTIATSGISLSISLLTGWNLITIPVEKDWFASDISNNITGCMSISRWDRLNQTYKTYIAGGPAAFDFPIRPGNGYFLDMDQSDTLEINGTEITYVSINLEIGWNLLGWYKEIDTTAKSIAGNITGCVSISKWDASAQTYKTYIVGGPDAFDFTVTQGMGLFVDVNQESTWFGQG